MRKNAKLSAFAAVFLALILVIALSFCVSAEETAEIGEIPAVEPSSVAEGTETNAEAEEAPQTVMEALLCWVSDNIEVLSTVSIGGISLVGILIAIKKYFPQMKAGITALWAKLFGTGEDAGAIGELMAHNDKAVKSILEARDYIENTCKRVEENAKICAKTSDGMQNIVKMLQAENKLLRNLIEATNYSEARKDRLENILDSIDDIGNAALADVAAAEEGGEAE